jgi:glycosyltransferase involved in cell wall biosynthesis
MRHYIVSAVALDPARQGGGETYLRRLVLGLSRITLTSDEKISVLKGSAPWNPPVPDALPALVAPIDPAQRRRRILWEELSLPRWMPRHKPDVVHFAYGTAPRRYRAPHVLTVHDTLRFFFPGEIPSIERLYKSFVEGSVRRNQPRVICVSNTDADAFCQYVNYPRDRVTAVYHGVDHDIFKPPAQPVEKEELVAWVGRPYPRKNLDLILRAIAELRANGNSRVRLLLVGPSSDEARVITERATSLNITSHIQLHPPVPAAQLPALLSRAKVFCYPSKYESFGLPVIEAMACGLACVCSDHPVFRELHRDVPLYCDPLDPSSLATQIQSLLSNDTLRLEKERRSLVHAQQFTWERCAAQTLDVYRQALK